MFQARYTIPLTAAALSVLLAACGGSEGGATRGLSSSPGAPGVNATAQAGSGTAAATPSAGASAGSQAAGAAAATIDSSGTIVATGSGSTSTSGNSTGDAAASQSNPATPPATTTPATVSQPAADIALMSGDGVRGDVLLAMIDQQTCKNPARATAHDGTAVDNVKPTLPPITAGIILDPNNYQELRKPPGGAYAALTNILCDRTYYQYASVRPGQHQIRVFSNPTVQYSYLNQRADRDFNPLEIKVPMTVTADLVTLGDTITTNSAEQRSSQSFSFRQDALVSHGVLSQWTNEGGFTKLMLLPSDAVGTARLCWNADTATVKRLQCGVWRVPTDWGRDKPLELVDQYIVDDRAPYADESGFLYWRTNFRND